MDDPVLSHAVHLIESNVWPITTFRGQQHNVIVNLIQAL